MKKMNSSNSRIGSLLRPIERNNKPVTFRTIVKCRNGDINKQEMEAQTPSLINTQSLRQSRYSSTGALDNLQEAQSPIKIFVKEHITKKPTLHVPPSLLSQRSQIESDPCNESRVVNSSKLQDSLLQSLDQKTFFSLEELKKKVQHLLELNIERCRLLQGKGQITVWLEQKKATEVEAQLLMIEDSLKKSKEEDQNLADIVLRIELIESALAGQAGESQALKKNYYNKKSQFYNTASFLNKHALKESLKLNTRYNPSILACQQTLKREVLKCSSSSKQFYKAPKREFYVPAVKNIRKYEPNRCHLPMTSYEKEFLNYQSFPTFPKQRPSNVGLPDAPLSVKTSNYQNQFNDKSSEVRVIDYRELDCTRNKLKNIDINFMQCSRKPKNPLKRHKSRPVSKQNVHSMTPEYGMHSLDQFYKTEQMKNYSVRNDFGDEAYRSTPKNKQLLKLKQNFRLLAQAL